MTYSRLQFAFPDFPLDTLPPIPSDWQDTSWTNDTCPSFETPNGLHVYIDYLDPALRECAEQGANERFSVIRVTMDGYIDPCFWGDDWQAVLDFVRNYK